MKISIRKLNQELINHAADPNKPGISTGSDAQAATGVPVRFWQFEKIETYGWIKYIGVRINGMQPGVGINLLGDDRQLLAADGIFKHFIS